MKLLKQAYNGCFPELKKTTQNLVSKMLQDTIDQVDGWKDAKPEEIEFESRAGFIPNSFNRGGLEATQFTDLYAIWASGTRVSHKGAQKQIEDEIEYGLKCARESFFENNTEELKALGIKDASGISYHALNDLGGSDLAEDFAECENENLSDEGSSIMFGVRFMYHGTDENGLHSASVSCAVNTEGPYHRSSIAWAPSVFCEGAKEVEISWKTDAGLKRQLKSALNKTSGEVF